MPQVYTCLQVLHPERECLLDVLLFFMILFVPERSLNLAIRQC